jgi:hypothetical protein
MVCYRLSKGFAPNMNSFRFSMFQFQFLRALEGAGTSYAVQLKQYNQSLGKPPMQWVHQLQHWAQETMLCNNYEALYPCMGCMPMSPRSLYGNLLNALQRSEKYGYHRSVYVPKGSLKQLWECACGKKPCMYEGRLDVVRTREEVLGLPPLTMVKQTDLGQGIDAKTDSKTDSKTDTKTAPVAVKAQVVSVPAPVPVTPLHQQQNQTQTATPAAVQARAIVAVPVAVVSKPTSVQPIAALPAKPVDTKVDFKTDPFPVLSRAVLSQHWTTVTDQRKGRRVNYAAVKAAAPILTVPKKMAWNLTANDGKANAASKQTDIKAAPQVPPATAVVANADKTDVKQAPVVPVVHLAILPSQQSTDEPKEPEIKKVKPPRTSKAVRRKNKKKH